MNFGKDKIRVPPHDVAAEQSVIGGLMIDPDSLSKISDWITEEDFYRRDHQLIYRAISELKGRDITPDTITMAEWFDANGLADLVGGTKYIMEVANTTPSAANIVAYADIVKEKMRLRQLIDIGTTMATEAFGRGQKASDIASAANSKVGALVADPRAGGLSSIRGAVSEWFSELHERYERKAELTGLETPWRELNDLMLGWQGGDLILIPARPNAGKSAFAFQAAAHNAIVLGNNTAVFSLEMRKSQFVQRCVASLGKLSYNHLRRPKYIAEDEWPTITETMARISRAPLFIDDQPRLTARQIEARAKRQHLRTPLTMIVVDHLHEMKLTGRDMVNELGEEGRTLRALGKELNVPVLLLAQLNRGNMERTDHRPRPSDIRGSGSIEEIADVILLVHKDCGTPGAVEIIVGKAREFESGKSFFLQNSYSEMRLDDFDGEPPKAETKTTTRKRGLHAEPKPDPREVDR